MSPSPSLTDALQGAVASPPTRRAAEPALLLGAGGWLGAALLAQLLHAGLFARVGAWVLKPERWRGSTHRGVVAVDEAGFADAAWQGACAFGVLERAGLGGARDAVFGRPQPEELLAQAARLHALGVRRLVLLQSHLPGILPEALRHGFADRIEQGLAALGFEQLLLIRSSREALGPPPGTPWLERLAALWWAQLRWMLPAGERPLRSVALARVAVAAAGLLREREGSVFVLPQEAASRAAQDPEGVEAGLRRHWPSSDQVRPG